MKSELKEKLKYLRLSELITKWDYHLEMAQKNELSYTKFLESIIDDEFQIKQENSLKLRLIKAKIPEKYAIETFPFEKQPKLDKKKIMNIYDSFDYVKNHQNVIWMGPTGSGKSGLATSFLIQAINRGYTGKFIMFPELIEELYKAIADNSENEVIKKFSSYDCLLIDEVGYVEVEASQVGLFFTLMHKRHRKKSTIVTSNIGFSEWASFLKSEQLTAALIDRLTESSYVINMKGCVSLRPKQPAI
ncbi:MAG: ATP-binding protein [Candidatus Riflebacteria bacterium]|nr:ATP-binding protein [Candidatus Riflebacteria bacterium]